MSRYRVHSHLRGDGYVPGWHAREDSFYPSRFAHQRWFKDEGRAVRDEFGWLRIGDHVYF